MTATLPLLREELRLLPAAPNQDGSPGWTVQDPVSNRFFRIGWLDFELLLRWQQGTAEEIIKAVNAETTLTVHPEDIEGLVRFLEQHSLFQAGNETTVDRIQERASAMKKSGADWLIHHYLFFRIPLVRPQRWLESLLHGLGWLFTRQAAWGILVCSLAGIFLAARQWDVFVNTFVDQLTWSGLFAYAIALVFSKAVHEMGHALTATRYGVRVAHMGVAMVVMFPMLYTDTGESWKLSNARQRLAIASAGIVAELGLAGIATLGWSLAPEGPLKSALFFLATISWVLTLAVNASPFTRFDGYFILSDIFDIPNLHERSGAMARVWLRRRLWRLPEPWPEQLPGNGNRWLIAFAAFTWVYRFVVFLGIALLVYHFFFKLLGLILFAVELHVFIARPIWSELKVWRAQRAHIPSARKTAAWCLLGLLLTGLLIPGQTHVQGPAWVHAARQQLVYSPLAGQLLTLPDNRQVMSGQTLFTLESPDLRIAGDRANALAQARYNELAGLIGLPDGEARRAGVQRQQEQYAAEAVLFDNEQRRMTLTAPFSGTLHDLDPHLVPGVWVHPRKPLAILIDPAQWVVDAYVAEADVARIKADDKARVRMGSGVPYFRSGRVTEVDEARTTTLPHALLDAQAGGPIVCLPGAARTPREALYRVRIALDAGPLKEQMAIGEVVIEGTSQAWLPMAMKRIVALVVRESGF